MGIAALNPSYRLLSQAHPPDVVAGIAARLLDQMFLVAFLGAVKLLERHDFGDDPGCSCLLRKGCGWK